MNVETDKAIQFLTLGDWDKLKIYKKHPVLMIQKYTRVKKLERANSSFGFEKNPF